MSTEAAIKIFDPRTAKLEPRGGKSSIHWDDIAAMLATLERENPVGYQMIMVNYRDDKRQELGLRDNVTKWAKGNRKSLRQLATYLPHRSAPCKGTP